ncbi:MAG: glycosyltransferase family 39 protein, partial [Bacteroidetes bacterium]|nr:glycosyltransferase family 39 protein [Bacteroidota bacterium]
MSSRRHPPSGGKNPSAEGDSGWLRLLIGGGIVLLAVGLRIVFLLQLQETPFYLHHFSDTRLYMQLAEDIAFGDGIPRAYFMSPLYPHMLAVVWKLTGNPELWMRFLQILFGAATTAVAMLLAERIFDRKAAVVAGIGTAVYAPLIFYDGMLLTESLQTLLLTLHLLLLIIAFQQPRRRWWIAAGVTLGLAGITRANVFLFLPVFLLLWMFNPERRGGGRPGHLASYVAAALLMLFPTAWHNAAEEGVFLPVTASFGYNLYAGNNAEADGFYSMPDPVDLYSDPNGGAWVRRQTGRDMNASEVSAWWRDRALAWMGAHPAEAAVLFLRKLLLFFHPEEIDQLGLSMSFFSERFGAVPGIPPVLFPLLFILSCAGAAILFRRGEGAWIVPVFLLVFVIATALFFVSGRLRIPILPAMFVAAAGGVMATLQT